ncbi:MAG: hypothetical protein ACO4CZ_08960 [Planctomycetota bacterium]
MSLFGTGRKEGITAVLVLMALVVVQHAPAVWDGGDRDAAHPFVEGLLQAGAAFREGGWPTWNATVGVDGTFRAQGVDRFYPLYWPMALGLATLAWTTVAHAALASVLSYRMLRALAASRYSAFLGAGLFSMGWFLTCAFGAPREAFAACWLPWIVTCAWNLLFPRRRAPSAVLLGLACTMPFLTGGLATAWMGVALGALCVLAGLLRIDRADRRTTALHALAAGSFTFFCTAPLWSPWLAASGSAPRIGGTEPLPVAGLLGLAVPDLFGESGVAVTAPIAAMRAEAQVSAFALYPGALVLMVALLGLLRPKRTWIPLFWICVVGLALVLSIEHPLTRALHRALPDLGAHPAAPLAVFHLGVVILVALGLENFFDAPRARPLALPIVATSMLVGSATVAAALVSGTAASLLAELDVPDRDAWIGRAHAVAPRVLLAGAALASVFLAWQRLGVLRLKRLVAILALGEVLILGMARHADRADFQQTVAQRVEAPGRDPQTLLGAAPPGSAIQPSAQASPSFATSYRTLDRRPTAAEVRSQSTLLVEAPDVGFGSSTAIVETLAPGSARRSLTFEPAPTTRLLLVPSHHDEGWEARTDRGTADVYRAHRTLMAVAIPAEATRVDLVYREPGLARGLALAAFGVVLALGLLVCQRR